MFYNNKMKMKDITKKEAQNILKYLKPHIPNDTASKSFDNISNFNLFNKHINDAQFENNTELENIVVDKAKGLMDIFENFTISSNRLFILGSLDYFRIVLDKEKLDNKSKKELLKRFYEYSEKIEINYFKNYYKSDNFAYLDLSNLKKDFDNLEEYVSDELKILPKFDENSDVIYI